MRGVAAREVRRLLLRVDAPRPVAAEVLMCEDVIRFNPSGDGLLDWPSAFARRQPSDLRVEGCLHAALKLLWGR